MKGDAININGFNDKLDLPPNDEVIIKYEDVVFNDNPIDDANDDYKFLRKKFRYIMASGEYILSKSIDTLNTEPTPRIIEASSQILKNIIDISEKLLLMHEKINKIKKIPNEPKNETGDETKDDNKTISSSLVDIINELEKQKK